MSSVASPFKGWRDVYISLSAPANVGLYLLAPWFMVKGCRSRATASVISAFVALYPASIWFVFHDVQFLSGYYLWVLGSVLSAGGVLWSISRASAS